MAHSYELHVDVIAECWCCLAPRPFVFSSASDQVVCSLCLHHQGSAKAEARDREHVAMWAGLLRETEEQKRQLREAASATQRSDSHEIATLKEQLGALQKSVSDRVEQMPTGDARLLVESELVSRSARKAELAQRSIDRLMGVLSQLNTLHGDDPGDPLRCRCGLAVTRCAEWKAIEPVRRLVLDWEKRTPQR